MALFAALGIGPGDEVIVPSLTFVSSATSIVYAGATPVFADVDPDTFNLDPADVARKLGPVKGILAVHYGGQPADLAELSALAADAGVVLLEDGGGGPRRPLPGPPRRDVGDGGMFSFTPTKNITDRRGGMVITGDGDLAGVQPICRQNHGQVSPDEDAVLGLNWRLSEMQAAMGRAQHRPSSRPSSHASAHWRTSSIATSVRWRACRHRWCAATGITCTCSTR